MKKIKQRKTIIFRVQIPQDKVCYIALTAIFGIGKSISLNLCRSFGLRSSTLFKNVSNSKISQIRKIINANFIFEAELKREIRHNIKNLMTLRTYRGFRHKYCFPVRGQRSHRNARTQLNLGKKRLKDIK